MQSTPKRILVVEDDADTLELLQILLQEEGYEVLTSQKSGSLESQPDGELPDLILLDVLLSGQDGREIAQSLKSQEETQHISILMCSVHPGGEETARQAGADDFLAKPFDIDVLLARITQLL